MTEHHSPLAFLTRNVETGGIANAILYAWLEKHPDDSFANAAIFVGQIKSQLEMLYERPTMWSIWSYVSKNKLIDYALTLENERRRFRLLQIAEKLDGLSYGEAHTRIAIWIDDADSLETLLWQMSRKPEDR